MVWEVKDDQGNIEVWITTPEITQDYLINMVKRHSGLVNFTVRCPLVATYKNVEVYNAFYPKAAINQDGEYVL